MAPLFENDKSAFSKAVCLFGETSIENYIRNERLEPKRIRKATSKFDVYFRNVRQHAPEWAQFWDISESVFQRSADCIVFLEIKKQKYAICHGRSYGLLNASAITRNFGLITALNAIDPSAIICADTFTPSDIGIQKRIRTGRGTRIGIMKLTYSIRSSKPFLVEQRKSIKTSSLPLKEQIRSN